MSFKSSKYNYYFKIITLIEVKSENLNHYQIYQAIFVICLTLIWQIKAMSATISSRLYIDCGKKAGLEYNKRWQKEIGGQRCYF